MSSACSASVSDIFCFNWKKGITDYWMISSSVVHERVCTKAIAISLKYVACYLPFPFITLY